MMDQGFYLIFEMKKQLERPHLTAFTEETTTTKKPVVKSMTQSRDLGTQK